MLFCLFRGCSYAINCIGVIKPRIDEGNHAHLLRMLFESTLCFLINWLQQAERTLPCSSNRHRLRVLRRDRWLYRVFPARRARRVRQDQIAWRGPLSQRPPSALLDHRAGDGRRPEGFIAGVVPGAADRIDAQRFHESPLERDYDVGVCENLSWDHARGSSCRSCSM